MSRITAEYPPELARALATIISQHVTTGSGEVPLEQWQQLLPSRLQWPVLMNRVEDGGGLPSTAFHMTKCIADPLVKLRSRWFKRLGDTRHCLKNTAALISGCRDHMWRIFWKVLGAPQVITCFTLLLANLLDFIYGIAWQCFWAIRMLTFFSVWRRGSPWV